MNSFYNNGITYLLDLVCDYNYSEHDGQGMGRDGGYIRGEGYSKAEGGRAGESSRGRGHAHLQG